MRWFKRAVAVAVLSMTTALAGVGASEGERLSQLVFPRGQVSADFFAIERAAG